jgi:LPXTG-site transpeptidase (sortase) family protein
VLVPVLLLSAVAAGCQQERPAREPTAHHDAPGPVVPATTLAAVPQPDRTPAAPLPAGRPQRLGVPDLGVDAPVVPITAPGGVLTPPGDPQVLGWWSAGAVPGARRGSALVTGHTVHTGGGALDDLEQLRPGDDVWVATARGRIGYTVTGVEVLGKGELAQRATALFDQSVRGRLVLVTCEDWNGTEYLSNVVVVAAPSA